MPLVFKCISEFLRSGGDNRIHIVFLIFRLYIPSNFFAPNPQRSVSHRHVVAASGIYTDYYRLLEEIVTGNAFTGLDYQSAGFGSLEEMVQAIDNDNYRLWVKALDWPVFSAIDSQSGVVKQTTSIKGKLVCTHVRSISTCLGIERGRGVQKARSG